MAKLTGEQARIAIQFLQRVDLKGAEVPAFTHAMIGLEQVASAPDETPAPAEPAAADG